MEIDSLTVSAREIIDRDLSADSLRNGVTIKFGYGDRKAAGEIAWIARQSRTSSYPE